jgi:DNA repair protein RecO (recombination protein O)
MGLMAGEAFVISVKPFGERDALVELLCAERGKVRGLVKRGAAAVIQPFNTLRYEHFRRLDGQLGSLTVEMVKSRAGVWIGQGAGAYVVPYLSELLRMLLPEEHPYDGLYARVLALLDGPMAWRDVVAFELGLLDMVGYGLRLRPDEVACAENSALAYVSPASGRAVPLMVAKGWEGRLLELPACMGGPECAEMDDFAKSWRLAGHFIAKAGHGAELVARGRLGGYYGRMIGESSDALAA